MNCEECSCSVYQHNANGCATCNACSVKRVHTITLTQGRLKNFRFCVVPVDDKPETLCLLLEELVRELKRGSKSVYMTGGLGTVAYDLTRKPKTPGTTW